MKITSVLKIVAIIGVAVSVVSLIGRQRYSFSPETFNDISAQKITVAYIRQCGTKQTYSPNADELIQILKSSNKLEEAPFTGFRGEGWITFYSIELSVGSEPLYRIVLQTRESLKGEIIASFERAEGNATYYYGNYKANDLNELVKNIFVKGNQKFKQSAKDSATHL